jgi:hypothetical protein
MPLVSFKADLCGLGFNVLSYHLNVSLSYLIDVVGL